MKKLFFTAALLVWLCGSAAAQNRSIEFVQGKTWDEIVSKAADAGRLIFIDCYTDWCGPCKRLAETVFTQDAVADFFNANFVNAKFEMEKEADGVMLKERYAVRAFPTLLFIDPRTGEAVHRLVGAGTAEWLIDGARTAMNAEDNLASMTARYEAGDRDPQFITDYVRMLRDAYMQDQQARVVAESLEGLSIDELATPEIWLLISENINDPLSWPMREVMANREKFYNAVGQEVVDRHLGSSIGMAAHALASWNPRGNVPFDEARNAEMMKFLRGVVDFPVAQSLSLLEIVELRQRGEWKEMLEKMRRAETDGVLGENMFGVQYFLLNIESLAGSGDENIVREGVAWLDRRIAATENFFRKAEYSQSKVRLLTSIGDDLGADKARQEEETFTREGTEQSGGRAVRAIRMN
ncbi:MAG: thioredoxin [Rikenellaceae bacterium]|nr:thioredoxin [Rikenellaceae bacterium]MCL2693062.1 thioredoxin [Rikenellaceae bacterium]